MKRRILVVSYSQSGQLDRIVERFIAPFETAVVERVRVQPTRAYPFPWTSGSFFDPMPETVLEQPIPIEPLEFERASYDLVVVAYQPWFLSPSLPTTALFADEAFRARLADTPVVTVIGARNMWLRSQERVVQWLSLIHI